MNQPQRNYDPATLRRLTSAVMDGTATEAGQKELTELLRSDPAARDEYLALVDLHAMLATELASPPTPRKTTPVDGAGVSHGRRWSAAAVAITALAACLLISFLWMNSAGESLTKMTREAQPDVAVQTDQSEGFASVAHLTDTTWEPGVEIKAGDRLGPATVRLRGGFLRLEFDSGVQVTLEGPAEFELLSAERTRLRSGLLAANVPPGAEGFTVDTPSAEVVDLGTSFGIDLRDEGFADVSVFDGEVEIALRDASEKHLLTEGDSVRIGGDRQIERVEIQPERYERVWPISSGIAGSTESFRFLPPWPKRVRFVNSDEHIFVAVEGGAVDLTSKLLLDVSEPGECSLVSELTPLELGEGERIRSYFLHFHPVRQRGVRRADRVSGSITFDRPILGLIIQHEQLLDSSRRFGWRAAGEANRRRELDLTGGLDGDRVSLSNDRRTLTVDLISPGRSSDLIRVIVDAAASQPSEAQRQADP